MSLNLRKTIFNLLKQQPQKQFTARQLAQLIFIHNPQACAEKKQASERLMTDDDVIAQIAAEIGAQRPLLQKKHPEIKTTEGRPKKYYFSQKSDEAEVLDAEYLSTKKLPTQAQTEKNGHSEHSLYPLLSKYLYDELNVYSKRIDEKTSSNRMGKNGNIWLHPDIVGLEDLSSDWDSLVKDCVKLYADQQSKLWSFEVKILLNMSNVRESFFQAVSNSSWANFGYLVASQITGSDTLKELRVLCAAHGIGVIKLDVDNPSESQILIPAQEKTIIDWDSCSRLARENKDFNNYIKLVKQFYQTGEIKVFDWDYTNT
ncbi:MULTISPECIES: COG2958 family protein [Gilliamella]|uniref:HrgA protein n=1 Tax=Gilliamella apis TaxID=1970738 RepID=A0A2V4DT98_9GAMM|nr:MULTISPECIES: HrgA protein [Gilliamella]MBI0038352.1 HrgA protein [Gilliamella sp. B14384G10]MBI0040351.1 HrgA protein [Gilliamella sp. B14384G7]MBI0052190.1 HrgA protein [Gilliamella sp. B14384G13]MBI0054639.1 HrgA protein [Gilliamella sp. B14384H2]PXY90239.1 HrgA protein [Gilliamella apis]